MSIYSESEPMIILGIILLVIGLVAKISILTTIGVILLIVGAVLTLLGAIGKPVGGRARTTDRAAPRHLPHPGQALPAKDHIMGIGFSIFLLAVGAILAFAVDATVAGLDIRSSGWILMAVGVIGLILTMVVLAPRRRRIVTETTTTPVAGVEHQVTEDVA